MKSIATDFEECCNIFAELPIQYVDQFHTQTEDSNAHRK